MADLPGFYYDAEKNRYFPIKGPIPGSSRASSSAAAQKPTTESTRVYAILCIIYSICDFWRMACLEELRVSWGWRFCYLSLARTLCVCMFDGLWSNVLYVR